MKKKLFLLAILLSFASILVSCSAITGKTSLSKLKIKEDTVESIVLNSHLNGKITLNQEEAAKFTQLFNEVSEGIIPQGEIVSPDTSVIVYYKNGEETRFDFYGKDYNLLDIRAYDKEGKQTHYYHFSSNDLRNFVYETVEKYFN